MGIKTTLLVHSCRHQDYHHQAPVFLAHRFVEEALLGPVQSVLHGLSSIVSMGDRGPDSVLGLKKLWPSMQLDFSLLDKYASKHGHAVGVFGENDASGDG